ncbi:MAG: hypothetical protein JJT93_10045 [Gammaproteobacteria bacterium]|nr:hypothetical protein [Gammaproteobacteria bacterium]TVQ45571.1 MAG: hypothetical protein EA371_11655 [Gammaproteobacteria bacterium]
MNPFEFVILILVLSFSYSLLAQYLKRRSKQSARLSPEVVARLEAMEERLVVLERIVTDRREHLRSEFESLGSR